MLTRRAPRRGPHRRTLGHRLTWSRTGIRVGTAGCGKTSGRRAEVATRFGRQGLHAGAPDAADRRTSLPSDPAVEEATRPQGRAGAARRGPGARVGRRLASQGLDFRRTSTRVSLRWMRISPGLPRPKPSEGRRKKSARAEHRAKVGVELIGARGGSAPVRPQVMPETAMPNCTASTTACSSRSPSRPSPRASHTDSTPPRNESPAPTVSITVT